MRNMLFAILALVLMGPFAPAYALTQNTCQLSADKSRLEVVVSNDGEIGYECRVICEYTLSGQRPINRFQCDFNLGAGASEHIACQQAAQFNEVRTSRAVCSPTTFPQNLGNHTYRSFSGAHGTQVEYLAANGSSFLWYPGNEVILEGRWRRQGSDICFAYGANTYNPATGNAGGGFECMPYRLYWGGIHERAQGDILGLQGRTTAPFRLSESITTLDALRAKVGQ